MGRRRDAWFEWLLALGGLAGVGCCPADAATLDQIKESGVLQVCAHPNSLPFASKAGKPPGFQLELGRALASRLGVALQPDWITSKFQISLNTCDVLMDVIADREAQEEFHIRYSIPYYRSGAALVVAEGSAIKSFADLDEQTKVGVQIGSLSAMVLGRRHVGLSIFGFETDALDALAVGEIDAAIVTPANAGYFSKMHAEQPVRVVELDNATPNMAWNVSIGMLHSDHLLRGAVNKALKSMLADGTVASIYASYGITLIPPVPENENAD